jgi:hypothetical protein
MESNEDAQRLIELCRLLEEVRALAEAAPVDFFTQQLWESAVPARWKCDLLDLPEDQLLRWECGCAGCAACGWSARREAEACIISRRAQAPVIGVQPGQALQQASGGRAVVG